MDICIDTNRYVDSDRGVADAVDLVRIATRVVIPFVVVAELRAGFARGSRVLENERRLSRFLTARRVELVFADEATTYHYAAIFVQLASQGTPIPTNDIWIAAIALQHGLTLFSHDAHFNHLPQIPRI
jgi:tRNA(fMet)-specific endonuclease VapC